MGSSGINAGVHGEINKTSPTMRWFYLAILGVAVHGAPSPDKFSLDQIYEVNQPGHHVRLYRPVITYPTKPKPVVSYPPQPKCYTERVETPTGDECQQDQECSTTYEDKCETKYEQECQTEYDTKCNTKYENQCKTEYNAQCITTYEDKCETRYEDKCTTEYRKECETKYEDKCET